CTSGSQEALSTICLALCDPGDLVLVPDPCYPVFQDGPKIASCQVAYMPLKEEKGFVLDFNDIDPEVAKKAKMLVISYPNNPTCAIAPDSFYQELIAFAKKYDLIVLHDNAYSELVFDGKVGKSFLAFDGAMNVGIELNSLSKTFGLAGARLGFVVGNKKIVALYRKLKSNMDYGVFLPVQYAGIEALSHCQDSIPVTRQAYEDRRNALVKYFGQAGWTIPASAGTMFAWARIPDAYEDSNAFVKDLLKKTGIVVTPGQSFGQQGLRYVRLALVEDIDRIQEAGKRLAASGIWG
ncbi:aminotransferase class I/II-fold pyridoxal phosphate-dependent enzyme, partial [Absicoccus porci]|uniref:aminotransferase class I/II-fold pyridoxal phosphate-dependent enzyme n=2 Tax=Absicoccus TaxID=2718525 RepID=UPI003D8A62CF